MSAFHVLVQHCLVLRADGLLAHPVPAKENPHRVQILLDRGPILVQHWIALDRDSSIPRSLSEYLLVLSHGRWLSLGFGLFGLGLTLCAHYPPQSTPTLQERRQIFKRLWVKQISCHSADTFSRPRNRNLRIPRGT